MTTDWDEREHPRHPAGSPGGRGGEFRHGIPQIPVIPRRVAGPELWAARVGDRFASRRRFGNDQAGRDALRRLVENEEPVETEQLHGGQSATTRRHTYADGTQVVSKVYGIYPESTQHEVDAALVAEAVGAPAPVVIDGGVGDIGNGREGRRVWVGHIVGDLGMTADFGRANKAIDSDDGARIALLDALINNGDRYQNWMITPDGLPVAFDHGEAFRAFTAFAAAYGPSEDSAYSLSGFVGHHLLGAPVGDRSGRNVYKPNRFHPEDIRLVRERLTDLHRQGHFNDGLWPSTQTWLDQLEKHATGERRLIT